ncbi:MAG: alpha/beta hydrolase [Fimbriimonadaceae bacterium]|nr:alpha/beta hydrolase [Alphaproteobacteria bacterium]
MPEQELLQYVDIWHSGDDVATSIAVRHLPAGQEGSDKPGIMWLNGFKSVMAATKASALADWAERKEKSFLRFDYGGHGESGGDFEDGTIGRWRDEALVVFHRFAAGPQILVGSSMGGWIALLLNRLLRNEPAVSSAYVSGIVLIAPAPDMTKRLIDEKLSQNQRNQLERTGKIVRPSQYDEEPYVFTKHLIDEGQSHLLMDKPLETGCPVRILHGMQDPDVPWQLSLDLIKKLEDRDVALTLVKDGDHRLSREQDIARLLQTIESLS